MSTLIKEPVPSNAGDRTEPLLVINSVIFPVPTTNLTITIDGVKASPDTLIFVPAEIVPSPPDAYFFPRANAPATPKIVVPTGILLATKLASPLSVSAPS
ncbi:hypothetical protein D3C71_1629480 [compost metagenome]